MSTLLEWALNEMKRTPVSLLAIFVLSFFTYDLVNDHVSVRDFNDLKGQLTGVQYTLEHDHYDTRLHTIQTERFNLTQHLADERSKNREPDALLQERIDDLDRQQAEITRKLTSLEANHK